MLQAADLTIKLNPADDVVIARVDIPAGTELIKEGVRAAVNVPAGHKIAVRDVAEGQPVRRYNQIIGYSTRPIRAGEHVHVHNLGMAHFERDYAFGADYKPEPYLEAEYKFAKTHKWYMEARMITMNDEYSFDRNAKPTIEPFLDIVGRHFKHPKEGLGWDNTSASHMWRTIINPNRPL